MKTFASQLVIALLAVSLVTSDSSNALGQQDQPSLSDATVNFEAAITPGVAIISDVDAQLELIDNVRVASRDSGRVTKVLLKPNAMVAGGQPVVVLDDKFFSAEAAVARKELDIAVKESENDIDLRFAQKSAAVNRKTLDRSCAAFKSFEKSISKAELERLELELERSSLSAEQAMVTKDVNELTRQLSEERFNLAELRLKYRSIESPLDGEIADILVQVGEWVQAGQPVARIINLNSLRVSALIPQADVLKIKPGNAAKFKVKIGNQTISADGEVSFVSREINPVAGDCLIWIDVDNSEKKLLPGMRGKLTVVE